MTIKKIFVTGATGFIGRHLVHRLIAEGYSVGALVRPASASLKPGGFDDVALFLGDIRNYENLKTAFSAFKPDAVIHLVTYYAVMHRADEIGVMLDTNVKGTINLLEAAKESGTVKLFINTSTCAVYEQKKQHLTEEDAIKPQNLYALTKAHAEEACSFYTGNYGVDTVTLRLFPPYGPGDHERRLIPYVIRSLSQGMSPALTTGNQKWDFVYVDDIVAAYLAVLGSLVSFKGHQVFNIGTGRPYSIREVVERIRAIVSPTTELSWGTVPHRKNEVWFNSGNVTRAHAVFNWEPRTGIDEGLSRTIAWFTKKWKSGKA